MNNTTTAKSGSKSGSIAVYQRILPGKRPSKIEVLHAVYESYRVPDGKAFGRTVNTVLLRLPSGTEFLSEEARRALIERGLDQEQISYVNSRLASLAGPAHARTREMDILDAAAMVKSVVELSTSETTLAKTLREMLCEAAKEVGAHLSGDAVEPEQKAVPEMLKDTLALLNKACADAQALYKRLPKGDLADDVVLEFQKTWFSHSDMLNTFKNRKCFSRPARWTELRPQIVAGQVYKSGESSADGRAATNSNDEPNR